MTPQNDASYPCECDCVLFQNPKFDIFHHFPIFILPQHDWFCGSFSPMKSSKLWHVDNWMVRGFGELQKLPSSILTSPWKMAHLYLMNLWKNRHFHSYERFTRGYTIIYPDEIHEITMKSPLIVSITSYQPPLDYHQIPMKSPCFSPFIHAHDMVVTYVRLSVQPLQAMALRTQWGGEIFVADFDASKLGIYSNE